MLPDASSIAHRELIKLAAEYRLPAIYADKRIVAEGGMMSYRTDVVQVWRQTASYVERILRGAKPGDLPVQFPTKFELDRYCGRNENFVRVAGASRDIKGEALG